MYRQTIRKRQFRVSADVFAVCPVCMSVCVRESVCVYVCMRELDRACVRHQFSVCVREIVCGCAMVCVRSETSSAVPCRVVAARVVAVQ